MKLNDIQGHIILFFIYIFFFTSGVIFCLKTQTSLRIRGILGHTFDGDGSLHTHTLVQVVFQVKHRLS